MGQSLGPMGGEGGGGGYYQALLCCLFVEVLVCGGHACKNAGVSPWRIMLLTRRGPDSTKGKSPWSLLVCGMLLGGRSCCSHSPGNQLSNS